MLNDADAYGLSAEIVADLERGAVASFETVKVGHQEYLDGGASFSSWNDPATEQDETLGTFMTLAYKFVEHAEARGQGLATPARRLVSLLGCFNEDWHARYSQNANSPEAEAFRATLLVAALSTAFESDLRGEGIAVGFPVDHGVFDELMSADCSQGQGGAPSVSSAGAGPSAGGSAPGAQDSAGAAGTSAQGQGGLTPSAAGASAAPAEGGAHPTVASGGTGPAEGGASSNPTDTSAGASGAAGNSGGASGSTSDPGSDAMGAAGRGSIHGAAGATQATQGSGGIDEPSSGLRSPEKGTCACHAPGSRSSQPARLLGAWMLVLAGLGLGTRLNRPIGVDEWHLHD